MRDHRGRRMNRRIDRRRRMRRIDRGRRLLMLHHRARYRLLRIAHMLRRRRTWRRPSLVHIRAIIALRRRSIPARIRCMRRRHDYTSFILLSISVLSECCSNLWFLYNWQRARLLISSVFHLFSSFSLFSYPIFYLVFYLSYLLE